MSLTFILLQNWLFPVDKNKNRTQQNIYSLDGEINF